MNAILEDVALAHEINNWECKKHIALFNVLANRCAFAAEKLIGMKRLALNNRANDNPVVELGGIADRGERHNVERKRHELIIIFTDRRSWFEWACRNW